MQETQSPSTLVGRSAPQWRSELRAATLGELVDLRSASQRPFIYLDGRGEAEELTWGHVCRKAQRYGAVLRSRGVEPGDRVIIMLPTCPGYLYTFFGVVAAGAIPVPVYPPFNLKQLKQFLRTLVEVMDDCGASTIVYWKDVKPILGEALARAPAVQHALSLEALEETSDGASPEHVPTQPDSTAMLQYTSGSTGVPKGVQLSHLNLLHNVHHIERALELDPERDCCVSWLPLYHDMGLIGALMGALYANIKLVLMPPQAFLMRPRLWMQTISDHQATITVAPNFAYNLCATRISEKAAGSMDLSSLRVAMCGAEPIAADTFEAFREKFTPRGLRREAFLPAFGLAESTVATTLPDIHADSYLLWLDRDALEIRGRAETVTHDTPLAVASFAVGQPFPESAVQIMHPDNGGTAEDGQVGEIAFSGPSVMQGYFQNPEATADVLQDGWCRTGDLGFVRDGHLFVTGRKKDLIIRYGRNYYPQDIEAAAEAEPGVRKGCVIAFGFYDAKKRSEEVCVLAETRLSDEKKLGDLRRRVRKRLNESIGLSADRIELLPPRTLLKTSSGKLRRKPTRDLYVTGELRPRADSWRDRVGMVVGSQLHWAKRRLNALRNGR